MNTNIPIWLQVLKHYDENGYFYNGLTIPFLLGASTILSPKESKTTINDFISEIQDNSLTHKISLMKCYGINEYVIGILDNESEAIMESYTKPIYKVFDNFVITDNSFSNVTNIDDIAFSLSEIYQVVLDDGKYSINNGVWSDYNSIDKQRLLEILDSYFLTTQNPV